MPFAEVEYEVIYLGEVASVSTKVLFRSGSEKPITLTTNVKCMRDRYVGVKHNIPAGNPVYQVTAGQKYFCEEHYRQIPTRDQIEAYLQLRNKATFIRLIKIH